MDPLGDHTLRCGKKGLAARTKHWHDKLVRALARNLRSLGLRVSVEVAALPSERLPHKKRADLVIYSADPSTHPDIICDVRTCLPSLPHLVKSASFTPGHAAASGQRDKIKDWHLAAALCHCAFYPLAFEDGGRVGPYVTTLINGSISDASSNKGECAARQALIWRDLSITNMRGVADTILKNPPPEPDPDSLTLLHRNSVLTDLPPLSSQTLALLLSRPLLAPQCLVLPGLAHTLRPSLRAPQLLSTLLRSVPHRSLPLPWANPHPVPLLPSLPERPLLRLPLLKLRCPGPRHLLPPPPPVKNLASLLRVRMPAFA